MALQRRPIEVFSLSFLDIISCGFGAIVLLLVLSLKMEPATLDRITSDLSGDIAQVEAAREEIVDKSQALQEELGGQQAAVQSVKDELTKLEAKVTETEDPTVSAQVEEQARIKAELELVLQTLTAEMQVLSSQESYEAPGEDAAIGGIPVDSEYVIFVIDTSGSMRKTGLWKRVRTKMEQVLSVYPDVKGLQVVNDMGKYMFSGYAGRWIPDSPARRRKVIQQLGGWDSFSNSSPVEGIKHVLRLYSRKTDSLSVYVFGDDFSGDAEHLDFILKQVGDINERDRGGRTPVRVHTFGFSEGGTGVERWPFAHLMRLLAEQNSGSFVGLTGSE